ncbi:glycosyl hydrolase 2 galactose-binding domain-containing protein [Gaoshiqia sp. Z1-71]|uniref:glycosyl hydrolase 2 galactose-binding domain-containing protein n=1 Tax=Gaoshiqia hydrogeniformans TaxID=3290090 RepID=UPI003BF82406
MKNLPSILTAFLFLFSNSILFIGCGNREHQPEYRVESLSSGWKMQSEDRLSGTEEKLISENEFDAASWYEAIVPGTVLGSMAATGVIENPYFGINMQDIDPEQFKQPWWFRTTFNLSAGDLQKNISLRFNGINYRADLWVNGQKVARKDRFAGTYRMFTFPVNDFVKEGENTLALKMWQHEDGEYSIGFVDWNPLPRDRNLGIFREVFLEVDEGVKIRSPFVYAKVNTETKDAAQLFIQTEVENHTSKAMTGTVRVDYELGVVEKKVNLQPGETFSCRFTPDEFKQLSVENVKLWWPNGMGEPSIYRFTAEFVTGNKVIDQVEKPYGIREIRSYLDENKNRAFEINGKFVLLKGGGWTDDVLLQDTRQSVEAQLRYVRHMNLNSIRCEGFWGKDETLYDLCDEYGILVMIGYNCHWEWEEYLLKPTHEKYGGAVTPEDIDLLAESWKDQMLWLRNHPSIYVWMLGSDKLPHPDLERKYIELFKQYDPSRSYITSAGGAGTENNNVVAEVPLVSDISGPTGMKMMGPYAWTPPYYWFTDTILGGAWGFNTETCPGASIPPVASLRKMLPEESLWPIDKKYWEYHTGRNEFTSLDRDRAAIDQRYGKSANVEDFSFKAQVNNYEIMRPMFEAFVAHKPKSTGLVQWKLNSAWPELIWQLYDTYLQPNGSFYGVRKACNPVHAIYRYGFDDIYLANEDLQDQTGLTVKLRIFDIHSTEIFSDQWKGDIPSNISKFIYKLPEIRNLTPVYFLALNVFEKDGREVDNSIYWLSVKKDVLDYEASKKLSWPFYTPTKQFADFTALNRLPKVKLTFDYRFSKEDQFGKVSLKVKNPSATIAFFNFFDLLDPQTGLPVLPVYWDDNYVSLLPGEERVYNGAYFLSDFDGEKPIIEVRGWNVDKLTLNE